MRRRWYELVESLKLALQAIRANTARGVLTTLGIIIGVMAVTTTMTAVNGLANSFKESVSTLGADVVYVSRRPWIQRNFFDLRNRPNVELKEATELARALRNGAVVNPSTNTNRSIKYASRTVDNIDVLGTTDRQMLVSASVPEFGRFLNAFDVQAAKPVVVIGSEIRTRLFEGVDPINKQMKIGRATFRVIGIMEKQGSAGAFGGPNFDSQVFVPITTFAKVFGTSQRDINIAVKAPPNVPLADFEYEVIGEMRKIRKLAPGEDENFSINKMDSLLNGFNQAMGVVLAIGLIITGISLFVGGVGVMNIMFVSVTERTREIGIRKAIGARRRSILIQFLFEATIICLLGGLAGILLAVAVTALINTQMPASLSPGITIIAMVISIVTGVLSGIVPAFRAAKLDPIESLRYE